MCPVSSQKQAHVILLQHVCFTKGLWEETCHTWVREVVSKSAVFHWQREEEITLLEWILSYNPPAKLIFIYLFLRKQRTVLKPLIQSTVTSQEPCCVFFLTDISVVVIENCSTICREIIFISNCPSSFPPTDWTLLWWIFAVGHLNETSQSTTWSGHSGTSKMDFPEFYLLFT